MYTLYLFRRDLRIDDNMALYKIIEMIDEKSIIPCFIFTPEQTTDKNKYRSLKAIQFMIESLQDLDDTLHAYGSRLHYFQGDNIKVLENICKSIPVTNIVFNMDYTPYAQKRDKRIQQWCLKHGICCHITEDYLLANIGTFLKKDNTIYQVFTPFKNNILSNENIIPKPSKKNIKKLLSSTNMLKSLESGIQYTHLQDEKQHVHGGRVVGKKMLDKITNLLDYDDKRNCIMYNSSNLSAYIKFGCLSIREVYWKLRKHYSKSHGMVGQLIWREFYYYIAYYSPDTLHGIPFQSKYKTLKWDNNANYFNAWKSGNTGFPIVDASMRQMNITGYMNNRSRLITANFLVRILNQDWRKGEQYFATRLIDYDPSVNNGNWQWISSIGVDPKPHYQRLFNPWKQSRDYDPNAIFIKKWIHEMKDIPAEHIHEWYKWNTQYKIQYAKPIVDYKKQRLLSLEKYKRI